MNDLLKMTVLAAFLALLCASPCVMAQVSDTSQVVETHADTLRMDSCQSTLTKNIPLKEWTSLVRGSGYYRVEHLQSRDEATGTLWHTFVLTKYVDNNSRVFKTDFNYPVCDIDITDMRLFQGVCYFCGTKRCPLSGSTQGVIGHFSVALVYAGTGNMYIYIDDKVSQLSRLAISEGIIDNELTRVVSVIGKKDNGATECLVEYTQNTVTLSWQKRICRAYYPNGILFSELLNTGDSLTLLSQFRCANQEFPNGSNYDYAHQIFLLDRFKLSGCSETYNPIGPYFMANYIMDLSENCSYHFSNAPMRLFHIDDNNHRFGVAFGVRRTSSSMGGMRLFTFQNIWQYDSSIFYTTGVLPKIKDIGNLYTRNNLFVISSDESNTKGVLSSPVYGGTTPDVTLLRPVANTINSLAQRRLGDYIVITGHNSSSDYMLYRQYGLSFADSTCFNKESKQYSVQDGKRAAQLVVKWEWTDRSDFDWVKADLLPVSMEPELECEKCPQGLNYVK